MDRIEHIIVLMLENRSFDHLFGYLDHPKPFNGLTGNESNPTSKTDPTPVPVYKGAKTYINPDPGHSHSDIKMQMELGVGSFNDGFHANFKCKVDELKDEHKNNPGKLAEISDPKDILACFDPLDPNKNGFIISELAKEFTLCDNWFCSVPGETWPNRNFVHAGTSDGEVNIKKRFYDNRTVYEELVANNLSWQIYNDGMAQSWVFPKLWFLTNGGFRKFKNFKSDVENDRLANYVFIEPRHMMGGTNNMHPGNNQQNSDDDFKDAENLIAFIYNTLVTNPAVFEKSLFVVTFDEHGGFYDHEIPPVCVSPDGKNSDKGFEFKQLGIRIPTILISPYTNKAHIDTTLYDHTSIIKSVFENFGINTHLTERDKQANSFLHNINLKVSPIPLNKINAHPQIAAPIAAAAASLPAEDLNDFQKDLLQMGVNIREVMSESLENVNEKIENTGNEFERKEIDLSGQILTAGVEIKSSNIDDFEDEFLSRYGDN